MKIINSTDYPDWFLRRMVGWCCRRLGLPVRHVHEAKFRAGGVGHARGTEASGRSFGNRNWGRFVVTHGRVEPSYYVLASKAERAAVERLAPGKYKNPVSVNGKIVELSDAKRVREEARERRAIIVLNDLVLTTAHELAHLWLTKEGVRTRRGGRLGGSERQTNAYADQVYDAFRADRKALLEAWMKPPKQREPKPRPSLQEKRAKAASDALARWQRKLKLAQTKVKTYRRKVRYYERALAAKGRRQSSERGA